MNNSALLARLSRLGNLIHNELREFSIRPTVERRGEINTLLAEITEFLNNFEIKEK